MSEEYDEIQNARILRKAQEIINAEDARNKHDILVETYASELKALYLSPTRNAKRIKELEDLLGWNEPPSSSRINFVGGGS